MFMSEQNPYEQLGVTEESSFEEIQEAKQRLVQQYQNDSKIVESIRGRLRFCPYGSTADATGR
jgi:phosphoheptose isomerase